MAVFLARRDEATFREMYRRHTPALFRFAVLRAGAATAEDVVQEAWLRAIRGLPSFRGGSSLRTWLTGIVLNICRERIRGPHGLAPVEPEATTELGTRRATRIELRRAIRHLPERAREILILHDIIGHTHEEIAALLTISSGTSKSQLHRARRTLRARLAGEERSHGSREGRQHG